MPLKIMEKLLDINELSEILGVTKATIYSWTSQNKIPHIKLSKRLLKFRENEIMEWLSRRSAGAGQASARKTKSYKRLNVSSPDDYIERIVHTAKEDAFD